MNPTEQFLVTYFTDNQTEMRWRREVEYKLLASLIPLSPLLVGGLFALSTVGNVTVTTTASLAFVVFVWILYWYVQKKVKAENSIYQFLGQSSVKIWDHFKLFDSDASPGKGPILPEGSRNYGKGSGYKLTLDVYMLISVATTLMLFGIAGISLYSANIASDGREPAADATIRLAAAAARSADPAAKEWRLHSLSTAEDGTSLSVTLVRRDQDTGYKITVDRAAVTVISVEAINARQRTPASPPITLIQAQSHLQTLRIYTGKLDGLDGPLTQNALRAFQRMHRLDETGQLDALTRRAIGGLSAER